MFQHILLPLPSTSSAFLPREQSQPSEISSVIIFQWKLCTTHPLPLWFSNQKFDTNGSFIANAGSETLCASPSEPMFFKSCINVFERGREVENRLPEKDLHLM